MNTITDIKVFEGLMKAFPEMDPKLNPNINPNPNLRPANPNLNRNFYLQFLESRRGFAVNPSVIQSELEQNTHFLPDANHPTIVGNPFRGVSGSDLMTIYQSGGPAAVTPAQQIARARKGVNAGIMRSSDAFAAGPVARRPLFVPDPDQTSVFDTAPQPVAPIPLRPSELRRPYRDQDRNPFFRYQGVSRLSNLVTNQSNVFAIWITVGYFEVEPIWDPNGPAPDRANPEGYMLGREVGIDDGDVVRHRSFYIVDRSIPVAFVPGQNHNVDRTILLRRRIE